jgi:competence protein ComEA
MDLEKKISDQVTGFLLLLLILLLLFSSKILTLQSDSGEAPCAEPLFVQVDGDVRNPGVFPFCSTPTFQDLLEKAGGLKEGETSLLASSRCAASARCAASSGWSISSGARVVFTLDGKNCDIVQSQMSPFHKLTLGIPLSLNKESEEGLTAIPGIGPGLAKTIVEERDRRGGFRDLDELMSIPGIGRKVYVKIRSHLVL